MRIFKATMAWLTALLGLLAVSSCQPWYDREPLEVLDPRTVRIKLVVDWHTYAVAKPTGMTVMLFHESDRPRTIVTHDIDSVFLDNLEVGHYRLVLFNKSVGDYPSMRFINMDAFDPMMARATTFTPSRYTAWTHGETFTYDPEMLDICAEEFDITEEMLLRQGKFYPYKEWIAMMGDDPSATLVGREVVETYIIEAAPKPVPSTLYVRVHITNIHNLASIEGHITGFADGWHLTQDHATTDDATRYLLDKWTVSDDAELHGDGWAVASTTLWGEPHGLELRQNRLQEQHLLTLHLTLTDGTTKDYLYNVGPEVRYVTPIWDAEWSYTEAVTKTLVVTIWDRDPGNNPGQPDAPNGITPDPDKPLPDPDDPGNPLDPDDPDEPILPDVEGKDESGKSGWGVDVEPWVPGERVDLPI